MTNDRSGELANCAPDENQFVICHLSCASFWLVIGSRPLAVTAWVAAGDHRKVIKDLAAWGSLDPVTIPAEKMVIFWTSGLILCDLCVVSRLLFGYWLFAERRYLRMELIAATKLARARRRGPAKAGSEAI